MIQANFDRVDFLHRYAQADHESLLDMQQQLAAHHAAMHEWLTDVAAHCRFLYELLTLRWQPARLNPDVPTPGSVMQVFDAAEARHRFYRVIRVRPDGGLETREVPDPRIQGLQSYD